MHDLQFTLAVPCCIYLDRKQTAVMPPAFMWQKRFVLGNWKALTRLCLGVQLRSLTICIGIPMVIVTFLDPPPKSDSLLLGLYGP